MQAEDYELQDCNYTHKLKAPNSSTRENHITQNMQNQATKNTEERMIVHREFTKMCKERLPFYEMVNKIISTILHVLSFHLSRKYYVPVLSLPVLPSATVCLEDIPPLTVVTTTEYSPPGFREKK